MNAVGIDVSKDKSMVAVLRPFGEIVCSPFEVSHSPVSLDDLAALIKGLEGETRVVLEATGNYHLPVAVSLYKAGIFVSVVNPKLIHDFSENSLRKVKTDKKDSVKIANFALNNWLKLSRFVPEDETRTLLKSCYRQYQHYSKVNTLLNNNLISLMDSVFPSVNRLFSSPPKADGHVKWIDFIDTFWHCNCVSKLSIKAFSKKYQRWCQKLHYYFSESKASEIYDFACNHIGVLPDNEHTRFIVASAVSQLKASFAGLAELKKEMLSLAESLPEYPVVSSLYGVGSTLGPQLMAEIGDVRRFYSKKALVAYAGLDSPPNDSGQIVDNHKKISKIGAAPFRRTLFLIMGVYLQNAPVNEPVFQFMDRKRTEGKPYKVYMMAAANKFLRRYYAIVSAYLDALEQV